MSFQWQYNCGSYAIILASLNWWYIFLKEESLIATIRWKFFEICLRNYTLRIEAIPHRLHHIQRHILHHKRLNQLQMICPWIHLLHKRRLWLRVEKGLATLPTTLEKHPHHHHHHLRSQWSTLSIASPSPLSVCVCVLFVGSEHIPLMGVLIFSIRSMCHTHTHYFRILALCYSLCFFNRNWQAKLSEFSTQPLWPIAIGLAYSPSFYCHQIIGLEANSTVKLPQKKGGSRILTVHFGEGVWPPLVGYH